MQDEILTLTEQELNDRIFLYIKPELRKLEKVIEEKIQKQSERIRQVELDVSNLTRRVDK